jgi:DNA gyrase subunit A
VAGALVLNESEDLFAITTAGMIIRMPASEISIQGRDATGVLVMSPGDGQEVAAVSPVPAGEDDEDNLTL